MDIIFFNTTLTIVTFSCCLDFDPRLAAMQLASGCWRFANLSLWQIGLDVVKQFCLSFPNASYWLFIRWMKLLLDQRRYTSMLIELQIWKQWYNDSKVDMDGITFDCYLFFMFVL